MTPAQLALAWILAQRSWIVPIPGTTKIPRLQENIAAATVELTPDDLDSIERTLNAIAIHGDRYTAAMQAAVDR